MDRKTAISLLGLFVLTLVGAVGLWAMNSFGPAAPFTEPPAARDAGSFTRHVVQGRPDAAPGAPNLVLVILASARRDQFSGYGGPAELTPFLGALGAQGARFDDLIASGGWLQPAAFTLTTGHDALALGAVERAVGPSTSSLPRQVPTLAERLADAGYYTLGLNASPHTRAPTGLARGFDFYFDVAQGEAFDERMMAAEALETAWGMLRSRTPEEQRRPYYLQLILGDLHKPIHLDPAETTRWTSPEHRIAPYRTQLHRLDQALAEFSAELPSDNTFLMVVGATGEGLSMPPHHGHANGRNLYPSTVRVPGLIRGPGIAAGTVVQGLVSQLDLKPTVLALLGLPAPAELPGLELSALVRAGGTSPRSEAFVDTWYSRANRAARYTPTRGCIADFGSAPLAGESWQDACYDRLADPDFTEPLDETEGLMRLRAWRGAHEAR